MQVPATTVRALAFYGPCLALFRADVGQMLVVQAVLVRASITTRGLLPVLQNVIDNL